MNSTAERKKRGQGTSRWYMLSFLAAIGVAAILLYICAVLISKETLPTSLMRDCTVASVFLGCTAGGALAARKGGRGVLFSGGILGTAVGLLLLAVAALLPEGKVISIGFLRMLVSALAGGLFGGALCLPRRKKAGMKKSKKRRYNN